MLRADDVTDVDGRFVADPFLICRGDTWYLLFEVLNAEKKKGQIAYATSKDAINWNYKQVVLDEPFDLSYPYVFNWEGNYYMVSESCRSGGYGCTRPRRFPLNGDSQETS